MKLQLTVSFDGSWVLKHRNDEVLPISKVVEVITRDCRTVKIASSSFMNAIIALDTDLDEKLVPSVVRAELSAHYLEEITDDTVSLLCREVTDEEYEKLVSESEGDVEYDADEHDEGGSESASARDDASGDGETTEAVKKLREILARSRVLNDEADGDELSRSAQSMKNAEVDVLLDEIDRLPGSREFKAMCHELAAIAPVMKKNKAVDAFNARSYLFFINDGCGLEDDLALFAKLITLTGIRTMSRNPIVECKLGPVKDSDEPFEDAMRTLHAAVLSPAPQMLSVDISEWLNSTDLRHFKLFIKEVAKNTNFIPVFRAPYVDKYVQDRLVRSLGDMLFIRSIVIPPYSRKELEEYAARTLAHYGYKLNKGAWDVFFARLDDESADGRFYGLETVRKVVMELLYVKQVYDTKHKEVCDAKGLKIINARAAAPIAESIDTSEYGMEALKKLVGSEQIEKRINEIIAQIELSLRSGKDRPCIHMQFVGNPGTGKTTVARIVGKILKEKGILSVGNFFEHSGRDFCGRYIGETAPKTSGMCRDAYGSVMFIDEAYSLYRGDGDTKDFGREALDTLIAEMENHRSDFVVIMAGYTDDMKKLMTGNSGLSSRVPYTIEFPNFTRDQLHEIFVRQTERFACEQGVINAAKKYFADMPDAVLNAKEFSNARFVRNLFERTWAKASMRCQLSGDNDVKLILDDFERAIADAEFKFDSDNKARIGFRI